MIFLILIWISSLLAYFSLSLLDAYFYPGVVVKKLLLPPEIYGFVSYWTFLLLIFSLLQIKLKRIEVTLPFRYVFIISLIILGSYLPASWFVQNLDKVVKLYNDKEITYTTFYHLNYDQILQIYSFLTILFELSLGYVLLSLNWKRIFKIIAPYTHQFLVVSIIEGTKLKSRLSLLVKNRSGRFVHFFEKWLALFPVLFFLIVAFNILSRRIIPNLTSPFGEASEFSFYLMGTTIIIFSLLRKKVTVSPENEFLNILLVAALVFLVGALFSGAPAFLKILLPLFTLIAAFILIGGGQDAD